MIGSGFISDDEASDSDSDSSDSGGRAYRRRKVVFSPTDYENKDVSAEDFFDINELADEAPAEIKDSREDYDDIEEAIPAAKVSAGGTDKNETSIITEKNGEASADKDLMPPPPQNAAPSIKQDETETVAAAEARSKILQSLK